MRKGSNLVMHGSESVNASLPKRQGQSRLFWPIEPIDRSWMKIVTVCDGAVVLHPHRKLHLVRWGCSCLKLIKIFLLAHNCPNSQWKRGTPWAKAASDFIIYQSTYNCCLTTAGWGGFLAWFFGLNWGNLVRRQSELWTTRSRELWLTATPLWTT